MTEQCSPVTVDRMKRGRALYLAVYESQGGKWEANDCKELWCEKADRYLELAGASDAQETKSDDVIVKLMEERDDALAKGAALFYMIPEDVAAEIKLGDVQEKWKQLLHGHAQTPRTPSEAELVAVEIARATEQDAEISASEVEFFDELRRRRAQSPLMEATQAQHVGLPKGEPAKFVRNGKLETCQCRDCRDLAQSPLPAEALEAFQKIQAICDSYPMTVYSICSEMIDKLCPVTSTPAQTPQQPVAWTNEAQLGYLKDLTYAQVPMAMWASRSDSTSIPLYASPVSSTHRAQPERAADGNTYHATGLPACGVKNHE